MQVSATFLSVNRNYEGCGRKLGCGAGSIIASLSVESVHSDTIKVAGRKNCEHMHILLKVWGICWQLLYHGTYLVRGIVATRISGASTSYLIRVALPPQVSGLKRGDFIFLKKLVEGEGEWDIRKKILRWVFDVACWCIELPINNWMPSSWRLIWFYSYVLYRKHALKSQMVVFGMR